MFINFKAKVASWIKRGIQSNFKGVSIQIADPDRFDDHHRASSCATVLAFLSLVYLQRTYLGNLASDMRNIQILSSINPFRYLN